MKPIALTSCCIMVLLGLTSDCWAADPAPERRLPSDVLSDAKKAYQSLDSYTEEAVITYEFHGRLQGRDLSLQNHSGRIRLDWIRGHGFRLTSRDTILYLQKSTLTIYRPVEGQYVTRTLNGTPTFEGILDAAGPTFRQLRLHPALSGLLAKGNNPTEWVPDVRKWDSAEHSTYEGRAAWHLNAARCQSDRFHPQSP